MSQVRKLLQGNLIPKAEQGYKFHLDSQDIYLTNEDLAEIDQQFAQLPMERRQFLANTTNAIKKWNDLSGSRSGNLIDMRALTGLSEKELDYLREQKSSYIESALPKKTYYTKQAINDALNIIYATWKKNHGTNTPVKSEVTKSTKISNSPISLDFNNGVLSSTAGENITARNRIRQIAEHINAGDNSTYDASLWTNLDAIKSLLANNPNYADDLWTRMSTAGYKRTNEDEDFLRNFGIGFGDSSEEGSDLNNTSSFRNEDGSVDPNKTDSKTGAVLIWKGDPKYKEDSTGFYTSSTLGDNKPYIITDRDWGVFGGLNGDFESLRNGVIYNRRFYTPQEINALTGGPLYEAIQFTRGINSSGYSGREKWNNARQYVNWRGSDNDYNMFEYTPDDQENRMALVYQDKWNEFAPRGRNLSFADATNAFSGLNPGEQVLAVYDYNDAVSRNLYGFTKPKFYRIDKDGNASLINNFDNYNNYVDFSQFDPNKYIVPQKKFNNDWYEFYKTVYNKNTRSNVNVYRKKVGDKYEYYVDVNGVMSKISDALFASVDKNGEINNREISKGKHKEGLLWKKDGGKLNHIAKLQGGNYVPPPLPLQSLEERTNTPVETNNNSDAMTDPSYLFDENGRFLGFDTLRDEDRAELYAAIGDIIGTGISFAGPYGDLIGSGIGLASDATYNWAERKRNVPFWTRAGHLATNVGLDLFGLVPWAGNIARFNKLDKVISKIAKAGPVVKTIGAGLTAAGLYNAKDAFVKLVTEGRKSLTSDEWMQLTGGLQALINVGHGASRRASDARFAEAISKAKNNPDIQSNYRSKIKGADDVDIPVSLKNEEVNAIVESDAAGGTKLKEILVNNYGADKTKLDAVDDSKLLTQFGFNVNTAGKGSTEVTHVYRHKGDNAVTRGYNAAKDKVNTEYSKWGFITDLWNGSRKRQDYIDAAMRDTENTGIRQTIDKGIKEKTFGVNKDFEDITDRMIRRAYARSQARIGGASPNTTKVRGREMYEYQRPEKTNVQENTNANTNAERIIQPNQTQQKRNYVNELRNAQSNAKTVRESGKPVFVEPTPKSPVQSEMKKVYSAPMSTNRSSDIAAKREAIAKKRRVAVNLQKLKESQDPMLTLKKLSEEEAKDMVTLSESKLIDAIEESIQGMADRGMFRNNDEISYYRNNLLKLFKGLYRKGGVIKAQRGRKLGLLQEDGAILDYGNYPWVLPPYEPENISSSKEAYQKGAEAIFKDQEPGYPKLGWTLITGHNDLTPYRNVPVEELEVEEELPKYQLKPKNTIDANWKVPGWQIEDNTPSWKQGSLYPKGTEPKVGYNTTVPGVLGMNDFDPTGGVTSADIVTGNKTAADVKQSSAKKPDLGGGATQPISDKSKLLIPTISAIGAISNLFQSKRYADREEQKINSGRYNLLSQPVDLMSYYNPIFERRRQEINNRRMSGLLGSPTNDWTQYNAGLNQLQSQLDAQLGELTTQEGQDRFTRGQTNVGLRNQKYGFDTNTANENRKIDSSFNMASYDPKLAQWLRNWNTGEQFRLQMLNMLNKDINTVQAYKQNDFNMQQSREFESWLRDNFADSVAAYNALDYTQRMQYMDLEDYIERTNPNAVEAIRVKKQLMQEQYLEWLYRNGTTFNLRGLTGRNSPSTDALTYRKKGGTLRGKTRYTMEPDERIWVDNNKAAHNAVTKLSENTIKLLLRALK